ncbi:MAG: xanthine dehydrogenase family protein molybdopterin-binding subunit [Kofleriaceae bacterium]|nr:xanthine dehydrogenase family protein molybdopterin-binding subunit [Kofleriaceae bacterium]
MIGAPINRVDGPQKVTGTAEYAYEDWSVGQPLYGAIVGASIGHGRITAISATRAEQAPGVRRVITHRDNLYRPPVPPPQFDRYRSPYPVMTSAEVPFFGAPVALVVASTLEQARFAAGLVQVEYERIDGRYDLDAHASDARLAKRVNAELPAETKVGDLAGAFASAPVKIDQVYATPYEFSLPLEMHSCIASWDGRVLTVHTGTQIVDSARLRIAATLGMDPSQVRVISRFIGGGFGSKLGVHAETILAAIAARELGQPVKVSLTRQQVFQLVGNRPAERQHVRLGANRDGTLVAFGHDAVMKASVGDDYIEQSAHSGRALYAAPNRLTRHLGVDLNLMFSEDVRAPGEAPGLIPIECGMDELAHELGIDPIELRIKNEPKVHPETNVPYSDRHLVECYRIGAERFGWARRQQTPRSLREGKWLVGYGMAAAIRGHFQGPTTVAVRLERDGSAVVLSDMTDIGTGTYTILAQVAAQALGYPLHRVRVELGDSEFPTSPGSGGSWGACNSTTAAYRACLALRDKLVAAATKDPTSPLHGLDPKEGVEVADGFIAIGSASETITDIVARSFPSGLQAEGTVKNMMEDPNYAAYSLSSYGAHFAEVHVDATTAEIRVRRMLSVFDCGRVLNAKTARSQLIGGMIWGISAALHEDGALDVRYGSFVNRDFAQYLVPVHADIPEIDAIMLDSFDPKANELGAKGLGEVGICGAGAAIGNAVFNATGVRVRDFPITVEKLLPHLPH